MKGELSEDVKWVWISVVKETGEKENIIVAVDSLNFIQRAYLRFGAGRYSVKILTSSSPVKLSSYYARESFEVVNLDERENVESLLPSQAVQSDDSTIKELAQTITLDLATDLEKAKAIHDWVASNVAYDVEGYFSGTYVLKTHDALEILKVRQAVCEGYSNLTAALHRALGIPAKVIRGIALLPGQTTWGTKMNHAWNEIYVDGRWMVMDTTWDAGSVNFQTRSFTFRLRDKYFDPSPEIFSLDHMNMP